MGFGKGGPKEAWRNITQVMQMLSINGENALHHGIRGEAWAIPLARNAWKYLNGKGNNPDYYQASFDRLAQHWKKRWMLPRSERDLEDDWRSWKKNQLFQAITPAREQ